MSDAKLFIVIGITFYVIWILSWLFSIYKWTLDDKKNKIPYYRSEVGILYDMWMLAVTGLLIICFVFLNIF